MNRPLSFFNQAPPRSADAGQDLLGVHGRVVRPVIGGRRSRRLRKTCGGFYPSVMGNFVAASSKYIVPMALFAGYKLMTRKAKKGATRRKRSMHSKRAKKRV